MSPEVLTLLRAIQAANDAGDRLRIDSLIQKFAGGDVRERKES